MVLPTDNDYMAPTFQVFVEGTELCDDVTGDIESLSFEQSIDMISVLSVVVANDNFKHSDSPIWKPGNEIDLSLGYGNWVEFVGRGEIIRHLPSFPSDGAPRLQIKAYDRSWRMNQVQTKLTGGGEKRPKKKENEWPGPRWDGTIDFVVWALAERHGMVYEIDPDLATEQVLCTQKKGTTDYTFLRDLANFYGAELRCEYLPEQGKWQLRFLKAGKAEQPKTYTFAYAAGDKSTLISCDLEFAMPQTPTELQAYVYDRVRRDWEAIREEEVVPEDLPVFEDAATGATMPPIESMTRYRLGVAGHGIEVITRPFPDKRTAGRFLKWWFRRRKDHFVTARIVVPGLHDLRAGQTHELTGLGEMYSGRYYLTTVRHRWDPNSGYTVEATGNKVLD